MNNPSIGLALGSGAFRGLAHIGIIMALIENDIYVDCVAGSSIGAVIGALYCNGINFELLAKIFDYINIKDLIDLTMHRQGLIKGKKIEEYLRLLLQNKNIEDLKVPLKVVTTDIISGQKVIFEKGNLVETIRASISIPGIFIPVVIGNKMLVDGGIVERIPSNTLRESGVDIVIGVDVGYKLGDCYVPNNIIDIIIQSIGIIECQCMERSIANCDIFVCPKVDNINPYSLENSSKIIESGRLAMNQKMEQLMDIIKNKKNSINENIEQEILV